MTRWLARVFAAAVGSASVLLAARASWLIVNSHEESHFEYAVPALLLALVGATTAVVLWRRGAPL